MERTHYAAGVVLELGQGSFTESSGAAEELGGGEDQATSPRGKDGPPADLAWHGASAARRAPQGGRATNPPDGGRATGAHRGAQSAAGGDGMTARSPPADRDGMTARTAEAPTVQKTTAAGYFKGMLSATIR